MSPIDCEKVLEEIELYLDGELGDRALRVEISMHLSTCSPCMGHADFRRRINELVASKCSREEAPRELLERIRGMLDRG